MDQFYKYLAADRVQSTQRVADYMLTIFRRVRSLVADAQIDDDRSVDVYLAFLSYVIRQSGGTDHIDDNGVSAHSEGEGMLRSLSVSGVDNLLDMLPLDLCQNCGLR